MEKNKKESGQGTIDYALILVPLLICIIVIFGLSAKSAQGICVKINTLFPYEVSNETCAAVFNEKTINTAIVILIIFLGVLAIYIFWEYING